MSQELRYEIKFILNEVNFSQFKEWLYVHSSCRAIYPRRSINSIYFDDLDYNSVKDNLSGIAYRHKTRLRWYEYKDKPLITVPILEKKVREGRLGKKETIKIQSLERALHEMTFSDIKTEIDNTVKGENNFYFKPSFPTLYVKYDRDYFEDSSNLRVTIDDNILFGNPSMHSKIGRIKQVDYRNRVLELKFSPSMKLYVSDLMRSMNLVPQRHSKYLTGLAMFGQVNYI